MNTEWIKIEPGCRVPKDGEMYACMWPGNRLGHGTGPVVLWHGCTHWMPIVPPETEPPVVHAKSLGVDVPVGTIVQVGEERWKCVYKRPETEDTKSITLDAFEDWWKHGRMDMPAIWLKGFAREGWKAGWNAALAHASRENAKMP